MKKLILDTSVIIDFLRVKDKQTSLLYKLVTKNYQLSISIITHTELHAGKSIWKMPKAKEELETLLQGLTIISLETPISTLAGKLVAYYNLNLIDAVIAATAIYLKQPLVTFNTKDFKSITNLKLFSKPTLST